jgi:sulfide:quinone oxidoreductase
MSTAEKHQIVIVGGGTAGITVAARLRRADPKLDLAIIEPSDKHYYQPLWTLVGGGVFPKEASVRPESEFIPDRATWIRSSVASFDPAQSAVVLSDGRRIGYDWLIVAVGIRILWDKIGGLSEALGKGGVCSNYSYQHVDYTWECIRNFRGGQALFTMPNTAVKCGGAPQKIMYLAADYFRRQGVLAQSKIIYATAGAKIFAIAKYAATLEKVVARYGIETRFRHNLVAIRPEARQAVFEHLDNKETVVLSYDMIHVTPPMAPPECVQNSPLADAHGWCDVDKYTLQHVRYPNVFGIGDAANLPTSKTGAAIRKQAPVLVANLLSAMQGKPLTARYDGYTSCPIVTAYGRLVLAEFDYDHQPKESFPFDQSKERYSMWLLKKYGLPWMYWHGMLRGRM